MTCEKEHVAHVDPNQQRPERFWVTCDGVTLAELVVHDLPEQAVLDKWFTSVLDDHLAAQLGRRP